MKTLRPTLSVCLFLVSITCANAQWQAVRNDSSNVFDKVYAVTANTVFALGTGGINYDYFILRTNNSGVSWDSIAVNTLTDTFQLTEVSFINVNDGFVGGIKNRKQVLLKTNDNGNTWTEVTPNPSSAHPIISVHFVDAQNGFAAEEATLYKTVNGGAGWTVVSTTFNIADIYFVDMNMGFACGTDSLLTNGTGIVMKTSDGGQTWNNSLSVNEPLFWNVLGKLAFTNQNTGFTFLRYTNKLFRTLDAGYSWFPIVVDSVWYINDIDFSSENTGHILADDGKIFVTTDGGQSWKLEYETAWGWYGPLVGLYSLSFVEETGFVGGSNGLIKKHSASTGINEEKSNETVIVYPNPFSTTAVIQIADNRQNANYELAIFDLLGKIVHSQILNSRHETLSLALSKGIYFYKLTSETTLIKAGKIIKQ